MTFLFGGVIYFVFKYQNCYSEIHVFQEVQSLFIKMAAQENLIRRSHKHRLQFMLYGYHISYSNSLAFFFFEVLQYRHGSYDIQKKNL